MTPSWGRTSAVEARGSHIGIVDSWAFIELAMGGPRAEAVAASFDEHALLVTPHWVIAETFGFLARRPRGTSFAWDWLQAVRESAVRIVEPAFVDVMDNIDADDRAGNLSFTDHAVALVASRQGTPRILSADKEFRRLRLEPLFASA